MTASSPPLAGPVIKSCSCGIGYDLASWSALSPSGRSTGPSTIDGQVWLDLRLCRACRSTIAIEVPGPLGAYWLSFCDPKLPEGKQFLGACIVSGDGLIEASRLAWRLGCNPGGEIMGLAIPADRNALIEDSWRGRLLTKDEAMRLDTILAAAISAGELPGVVPSVLNAESVCEPHEDSEDRP